jgi:hypothetical protein
MKNRLFLLILIIISLSLVVGCGTNNKKLNNQTTQEIEKEEVNDDDDNIIIDDEPKSYETINCENCVFAFYTNPEELGRVLYDYTKDYTTLKDDKGKQRRRFMGHILDGNDIIKRVFVCGIEKGKMYCLEGATDSSTSEYNVKVLNIAFALGECSYNDDNTQYTCVGETRSDIRKDGYVRVHFDNDCHVSSDNAQFYCY